MTNEEAIRELEYILVGHPESSTRGQAVLMAIEAINRQIPTEPNIIEGQRCCAFCGKVLKPYERYCFICGQLAK